MRYFIMAPHSAALLIECRKASPARFVDNRRGSSLELLLAWDGVWLIGKLIHRKARGVECARILTCEVSIRVQIPGIIPPVVSIVVVADGIYLRLFEAHVSVTRTRTAEGKSHVEELDSPVCRQFPSPLAHHAREQTANFEFQPITVPLIVGFKPIGVMDIP